MSQNPHIHKDPELIARREGRGDRADDLGGQGRVIGVAGGAQKLEQAAAVGG